MKTPFVQPLVPGSLTYGDMMKYYRRCLDRAHTIGILIPAKDDEAEKREIKIESICQSALYWLAVEQKLVVVTVPGQSHDEAIAANQASVATLLDLPDDTVLGNNAYANAIQFWNMLNGVTTEVHEGGVELPDEPAQGEPPAAADPGAIVGC